MKKLDKIWVVDDEEEFRKGFVNNHSGCGYSFNELDDSSLLVEKLEATTSLPDLIILDLYRTNAKPGSGDAERANTEVNKLLSEIDQKTIELKKLVGELKEPIGLGVLSAIRNHSNSKIAAIPVIIYTRQGLSLISEKELCDATEHGVKWMMKGHKPEYEQLEIKNYWNHIVRSRELFKRDIIVAFGFTVLGALITPLFDMVKHLF